jgi:malonyl-CoA decarboxylase
LRDPLEALAARYLYTVRQNGRPTDPVARFHLGNGARIERINFLADASAKGFSSPAA